MSKDCTKCWWDYLKDDGFHFCCYHCQRRETLDACCHYHAKGTTPEGFRAAWKYAEKWQDDILDRMDRGHK